MRKKDQDMTAEDTFAAPAPAPSTASKLISPLDIQQKEFRVSRFGGYKMRDVDEFLDHVTDAMSAVLTENERLRRGSAAPSAAAVVGTADLADVNRQADEIIQRAREEAAHITAEAREQAAALQGTGVAAGAAGGTAADRAAINAFLGREKEFLQSLAGLVQGHAETVKSMARTARAAAPSAAVKPVAKSATAATPAKPATPAAEPVETPASRPVAPEPAAAAPPPPASESTVRIPAEEEEPVRVSEPEPVAVRRSEPEPEGVDTTDDSLRELFWGEE